MDAKWSKDYKVITYITLNIKYNQMVHRRGVGSMTSGNEAEAGYTVRGDYTEYRT